MFAARTSHINIVGDNKTLLNGRVVDVEDNGLYIDLLCKDRLCEFFPFNKVFLSKACEFKEYSREDESWETVSVEVLRREYPGGAWRWWPGKIISPLVSGSSSWLVYCTVAVVQGQDDSGATWTDIFPEHRIRFHVPDYWWAERLKERQRIPNVTRPACIKPGRFVKRSMPLPAGCRGTSAVQLLQARNEPKMALLNIWDWLGKPSGQVVCVDVVDGQLQYIVDLYDSMTLPQREDLAEKIIEPLHAALIKSLSEIHRKNAACAERGMMDGSPDLGVDVWQEVFAHLDTVTRTMLRTVCRAWDAILDIAAMTGDIVIDLSDELRSFHLRGYALTAPFFKCLRRSIKHVILHNNGPKNHISSEGIFSVLEVISFMVRTHPGIHLTALYVVDVRNLLAELGHFLTEPAEPESCEVHDLDDLADGMPLFNSGHLNHFIASCRGLACDAVHLVRCKMCLQYDMQDHFGEVIQFEVDMPMTRMVVNGDVASSVWDALETALPAHSDDEVRALSNMLTAITADNSQWFPSMAVGKVLCTVQTADPRPSSAYRGKRWCRDGVQDLRWEKLSRITLCFLLKLSDFLRGYLDESPASSDSE